MKITQIAHFVAAAQTGSLRAAARKLGIAQPMISRSLRELENDLNAVLLHRSQHGVQLTAAGELFLQRSLAIQAELHNAREELLQLNGAVGGEISVAMSSVASFTLMPKALKLFYSRHPDVVLNLTEGFFQVVGPQVLGGSIDLYVGPFREANPSRLAVELLFEHRRGVICRAGNQLSQSTSLSQLQGAGWVKPLLSPQSLDVDITRPFEFSGLPRPRVMVHTTSVSSTLLTVANSDLLTILPLSILDGPINANLFDVIPVEQNLEGAPICLVKRTELPLTPVAEFFADMVRRVAISHRTRRNNLLICRA